MATKIKNAAPWRIDASALKTLRGMIIDRDEAWRLDTEMAPVIESAIRAGLKRIDEKTWSALYMYLRYGPMGEDGRCHPLPGSYKTRGFDELQMRRAWRKYIKKTYPEIATK